MSVEYHPIRAEKGAGDAISMIPKSKVVQGAAIHRFEA
jgi:hypothetical protein